MLALAQTLFGNLLRSALGKYVPDLEPDAIIKNGATDLLHTVPAGDVGRVKLAYNDAITKTLVLGAACSALGVLFAFGMGWKKVPKKAKGKNDRKDKGNIESNQEKVGEA